MTIAATALARQWTAARLAELLADADACPRLSDWEDQFVGSLRLQSSRPGFSLTAKQVAALERLEAKVYAT